ncbi:hypothetical protein EG329_012439 [Mollisiaceae sp. DMI_Dod_QoI]|nr:hypothetical protein EG329_012439 [Helotiales sp. DMI_Dod_QoI]
MASQVWISGATLEKRESVGRRTVYSASIPIGSATLSLGVILVIAICGALFLFAIFTMVVILQVKKRNRRRNQSKIRTEAVEQGLLRSDPRITMRSIRTPEICFPRRLSRGLSFNPWVTLDGGVVSCDWEDVDLSDHPPPMATAKRLSFHRGVVRVRESWPLASNIPLKLLPSQTTMVLSPVAPPGYVVQEPKRQSAKLSRRRDSAGSKGESSKPGSPTKDLYPAPLMPYKVSQRRSTSETQLPSASRSASQRMKAIHRKSLTRTLTTINRFPGRAPTERLLTPPFRQATESREQLINKEFAESMETASQNTELALRLSLENRNSMFLPQSADGMKSPTPSFASTDSLCEATTPEAVMPLALSSPSKSSLHSEKRYKAITSENIVIPASSIHEDNTESVMVVAKPVSDKFFTVPHRISLAGDPFFSSVRSSKSIVSKAQVQGPRPMYFRKSTFGHEESPNRPEDYVSPLRDVSGNAQSPKALQHHDESKGPEHNPFRWSPQEAMKTKTTPLSGRTSPGRKGHRRSNVIRMSHLSLAPRHMSTVEVVHEEPEDESPRPSVRFSLPPATSIRVFEPEKSPSPSSSTLSRRRSMRPPSTATFSPDLTITEGVPTTPNSSPVSKPESRQSFSIYSPTLSVCNYYAESGGSEDEFLKPKRASAATLKARRHGHNYSGDLTLFPTHQMQQDKEIRLTSFPPPPIDPIVPLMTVLTPPPLRPLPTIASTMTGFQSTSLSPAPPLLTVSGQSQLFGPRDLPSRTSTLSPPRDSLASSISMLRRMNSQISQYSSQSTIAEESPQLPPHSHISLNFNNEEEVADQDTTLQSEGKANTTTANPASQKKESYRIYKDRRKRRTEDFERDDKELTPVPETSPATGANALGIIGLRFPTLNHTGVNRPMPPREKDKFIPIHVTDLTASEEDISDAQIIELEEDDKENLDAKGSPRWSDAMTKPVKNGVRRESKMEHPSPHGSQTPPKWTISGLGLAGQRLLGTDKEGMVTRRSVEDRPESLGLYDQDGFLKSSPELREKGKERRKRESVVTDEWHSVM